MTYIFDENYIHLNLITILLINPQIATISSPKLLISKQSITIKIKPLLFLKSSSKQTDKKGDN